MIPRLHRFYGPADPKYGSWWHVPAPKLQAYARMLSVLQAQESIRFLNDLALGQGHMPKHKADEQIYRLQALAAGRNEQEVEELRVYRPKSPQELASLGGSATTVIVSGSARSTATSPG